MPARLLDGVATADRIRAEILPRVAAFAARAHRPPGLGIVLVGENPASEIYVRGKVKSAGDLGIRVDLERLSASASIEDLLGLVGRLNRSDAHDGTIQRIKRALAHLLRDFRTDEVHPIDPALLDTLFHLQTLVNRDQPFEAMFEEQHVVSPPG